LQRFEHLVYLFLNNLNLICAAVVDFYLVFGVQNLSFEDYGLLLHPKHHLAHHLEHQQIVEPHQ
jgi:hypothetical protein